MTATAATTPSHTDSTNLFNRIWRAASTSIGRNMAVSSAGGGLESPTAARTPLFPNPTTSTAAPSSSPLARGAMTERVRNTADLAPEYIEHPPASAPAKNGKRRAGSPLPSAGESNPRKRPKQASNLSDSRRLNSIKPLALRGVMRTYGSSRRATRPKQIPRKIYQMPLPAPRTINPMPGSANRRQPLTDLPQNMHTDDGGSAQKETDKPKKDPITMSLASEHDMEHGEVGTHDDAQEPVPMVKIPTKARPEALPATSTASGALSPLRESPELPELSDSIDPEDENELEAEPFEEGDVEGDVEYAVKALVSYRRNEDLSVDIEVEWDNYARTTWEPETVLQEGAPDLLYKFWARVGGSKGRDAIFKENEDAQYHVFRVHAHRRQYGNKKEKCIVKVQWVGYSEAEPHSTWELETKIEEIAPTLLEEYWNSKGGRGMFGVTGRARKPAQKKGASTK
ncbi:hypothetical protein MKZ38_002669 [Zalerion maritima]|uniref:Chromo domain-containing protein n=1 Tax=Zalerion maritima TaxID=339359 RepID=A0AAD5RNM4_9PEZI|nr:hypothetical protein MKZ38_002669 [Zalerion maritima]